MVEDRRIDVDTREVAKVEKAIRERPIDAADVKEIGRAARRVDAKKKAKLAPLVTTVERRASPSSTSYVIAAAVLLVVFSLVYLAMR